MVRYLTIGIFLFYSIKAMAFGMSECVTYAEKNENSCEAVKNCSAARINDLEKQLLDVTVENSNESTLFKQVTLKLLKSKAYMYEEDSIYKGVLEINDTYELSKQLPDSESSSQLKKDVLRNKGIFEFRLGELRNCVENHNADSCIFPLSENARHKDKNGSTAAIASFMTYLNTYGRDEGLVWLLNIAHQTLGTYPDGVPQEYLFPASLFASQSYIGKFIDIAGPLGLQNYSQEAGGVAVDDFNEDGYLDFMLSSNGFCDTTLYFENDGNGGFIDKSVESGVSEVKHNIGIISADYDNDGDLDVYFYGGAWDTNDYELKLSPRHNQFYQNTGKGKFLNVTESVGLKTTRNYNLASAWGDYDNDGWVDLFVCNDLKFPELFKNDHGHFKKTLGMGVLGQNDKRCKSSIWGDVNNDGWQDLFLSYTQGKYELYINNKGHGFYLQPVTADEPEPYYGFGSYILDYDNDGWMDIFVASFDGLAKGVQYGTQHQGTKVPGETFRLFKNMGYGIFWDVTQSMGMDFYLPTMGINFGDANNDGFLDVYLGTGGSTLDLIEPNRLFLNINGKKYIDVTHSAGVGNLQKGHGIAFADYDNDGDSDILAQFGGAFPGDKFFPSLYQNPGNTNKWITVRMEGVMANRSAIGAKLHFIVETNNGEQDIYRVVSHGSTLGSNPLQVEVGLGNALKIKSLSILWRGDLQPEIFHDLSLNSFVYIKEGTLSPVYLNLKKLKNPSSILSEHHHAHE